MSQPSAITVTAIPQSFFESLRDLLSRSKKTTVTVPTTTQSRSWYSGNKVPTIDLEWGQKKRHAITYSLEFNTFDGAPRVKIRHLGYDPIFLDTNQASVTVGYRTFVSKQFLDANPSSHPDTSLPPGSSLPVDRSLPSADGPM